MKKHYLALFGFVLIFVSCSKENNGVDPSRKAALKKFEKALFDNRQNIFKVASKAQNVKAIDSEAANQKDENNQIVNDGFSVPEELIGLYSASTEFLGHYGNVLDTLHQAYGDTVDARIIIGAILVYSNDLGIQFQEEPNAKGLSS